MSKQNQTQQEHSDIQKIEAERSTLCGKIQAVLSQLAEIDRGIEQAEREKADAKASYNEALDFGQEDVMSEALSRVRQANSRRQELVASLGEFSGRIEALRAAQSDLMLNAWSVRSQAEKEFEAARSHFRIAEQCSDRCRELLSEMSSLDVELTRIRDATLPHEPAGKAAEPSGYPGNV
jgi:chromosome segregation ATPase